MAKFKDPEPPAINRTPLLRATGKKVWHDLTPNRFSTKLPEVQGPVRARDVRASKDRSAIATDPWGTPQLASQPKPPRD